MKKMTKQDGFYLEGYATGRKGIIHGGTVGPDAGLRAFLSVRKNGESKIVGLITCREVDGNLYITMTPSQGAYQIGEVQNADELGFVVRVKGKDGNE